MLGVPGEEGGEVWIKNGEIVISALLEGDWVWKGGHTGVEIEFDNGVFFFFRGIVMRTAFDTEGRDIMTISKRYPLHKGYNGTYTCTFRRSMLVEGF